MLKPTGFRKKGLTSTQSSQANINNVPMEIEFFGVMGSSTPDDSNTTDDQSQNFDFLQEMSSNYSLKVLSHQTELKGLDSIEVQAVLANDVSIRP
jgi:hypothetical protein